MWGMHKYTCPLILYRLSLPAVICMIPPRTLNKVFRCEANNRSFPRVIILV